MTTETTASDNNSESAIQIRKILVPIDGSESVHAAKYAIKIAKDENALIYIHVITTITLEYASPQGRDDMKKKVVFIFTSLNSLSSITIF
ncbi:MAG TPA: universal stress protein [Candidatus Bathyarchaeia archaeon]|nr:universal stress protein [Candidatus Bathyarchaeia archaeon]